MASASTEVTQSQRQIDLTQFLSAMTGGEITNLGSKENPPWYETGKTYEISEETYWYFLELIPPRWMSHSMFALSEGRGSFRLFWEKQSRYFARELTLQETELFCQLSQARRDT